MKYIIKTAVLVLLLSSIIVAQQLSPVGTEVVIPWATSYYAGLGVGNANFSDSLNGIAYTQNSPDYSISTDGGSTWRTGRRTGQLDRIMFMYSIGRDSLVAVRDSQYIYHSFNGGETWTLANTLWSGEKFGYGIFFNHKYGLIFPPEGGFLTSSDLGLTWNAREWGYTAVKSPPRYERGYLFVREQSTITPGIIYSSNNGMSWEKLMVPSSLSAFSYAGKSENGFYIVTQDKWFHLISPTGEIIKSFPPGGTQNLYVGHAYVSDNEIWIINHQGTGNRELRRYSLNDTNVTVIRLGNNSVTTNSIVPTTWDKLVISSTGVSRGSAIMTFHKNGFQDVRVEQLFLPGSAEASTLFFVNGSKGFAGLTNGKIIKTTDGGTTWSDCTMPTTTGVVQKFVQRSETEFIALCGAGLILETGDGGNSWSSIITPVQKPIRGAAFKGHDTIYFCTTDSLFRTTPLWQQITPVNTGLIGGNFTNLDFYDELNGSAIYHLNYYDSKAFLTTNGGNSWQTSVFVDRILTLDPASLGIYYPSSGRFTTWYNDNSGGSVFQDGDLKFVNQRPGGLIAISFSKGDFFYNFGKFANFARISLGQTFSKMDPVAADANTAYLLTNGGRIFKIYKTTETPVPSAVLKILPLDESPYEYHNISFKWEEPWSIAPILEYNFQLAIGNSSNIIEDVNGFTGTTLDRILTADSTMYYWRVRARNIHGWGDFNRWYSFRSSILESEPKMWQTALTSNLMSAIILPDGCAVVGDSLGKITRTDTPPDNWSILDVQTTYPFLRFWRPPGTNNIIAYTLENRFLISINKGFNWYANYDPFGGSTMFYALTSAPPDRYYGAGQYGTIYKGVYVYPYRFVFSNIWFSPYTGSNLDIATWGETRIAAVGELGSVTLSTDGGVSFRHLELNGNETLKKVSFAPDGTLVILNDKGERRISTDMGQTWTFEVFETRAPIRELFTLDGVSAIVDYKGGVYTAPTPTSKWYYRKLPEFFHASGVNLADNKILLPSQQGKLFYMSVTGGLPTGVRDEGVISQFELTQNYPNPFNSSTFIEFNTPNEGPAHLTVYDITGRAVRSEVIQASMGKNRFRFDANDLHSGVYIYSLDFGGKKKYSKMILLK